MRTDHMHYEAMVLSALRGVVRHVLQKTVAQDLCGDHHLVITFRTTAPGVELSDRLRSYHPETLTVILQNRFWNLMVDESAFEVDLTFNNVEEHLKVPFQAILQFEDPSINFVLPFHLEHEIMDSASATDSSLGTGATQEESETSLPDKGQEEDKLLESAEVVSFEAFRKK